MKIFQGLRRSIQQIAIIILTFVLVSSFAAVQIRSSAQRQLHADSNELLNATERNINFVLDSSASVLSNAAYTVRNHLQAQDKEDLETFLFRLEDWILRYNQHLSGFHGFYGFLEGNFVDTGKEHWQPDADYDSRTRPWYVAAHEAKGDVAQTDVYVDKDTGGNVISFAVELFDGGGTPETGKSIGVFGMDTYITDLAAFITPIKTTEDGYGILIDKNNIILAHPNPDYVGREFAGTPQDKPFEFTNFDGDLCIAETKKLSNGWTIGLITPKKVYLNDTKRTLNILFWLCTLAALLLSVMTAIVGERWFATEEKRRAALFASESKSRFLATMSHEIRTPMNAILGIAEIQLGRNDLNSETREGMQKIYSSGFNLLALINDILDLSKIETGKLDLSPGVYDVPSLINDTIQLNLVRINGKPIDFILDISPNLPARLRGDELRLKQILNNLLSNAFKYTERGSVRMEVSAQSIDEESTILQFVVSDTGQGMRPEDLEKLFVEYARFNAEANRSTEGTGLGLSITQKLIQLMDGSISVESEYNVGTTFTAAVKQELLEDTLPIGAETVERLKTGQFSGELQREDFRPEPMPYGRILVVDDSETNLFVTKGLLAAYSLKTETVTSGFEALEKISAGNLYDVIFMDHMMPEMDGIETTQKIRAYPYKAPIVALTANAVAGNRKMFLQNGFDDYISKPIDTRQLDATLKKFVRDRRNRRGWVGSVAQTTAIPSSSPLVAELPTPPPPSAEEKQKEKAAYKKLLMAAFVRDAQSAIPALSKFIEQEDWKAFAVTAHAMKSALRNIGETDKAGLALKLEKAGKSGDKATIVADAPKLIEALQAILDTSSKIEFAAADDTAFLLSQLEILQKACEDYNTAIANTVMDALSSRYWTPETTDWLNKTSEKILCGDYDDAKQEVEVFRTTVQ